MKKYLLPETGRFYKANLHCHTTFSDGAKTPEEVKEIYRSKGYSIVAYTDHNVLVTHDELNDDTFLALHGFEIDIHEPKAVEFDWRKTCHICYIALEPDALWHKQEPAIQIGQRKKYPIRGDGSHPDYTRRYSGEGISDLMLRGREKGFFVTYNHPTWSREFYPDYIAYRGMHAFEMFNGGLACGYDEYNPRVYDDFLNSENRIYCIGADDNHNHRPETSRYSECGKAFTVIKADSLDYRTITRALEQGNFYASTGPEIYALWVEDNKVCFKCSPVDSVRITYGCRGAGRVVHEDFSPVTEGALPLRPGMGFFRLTFTDAKGNHACTNAYFEDEL